MNRRLRPLYQIGLANLPSWQQVFLLFVGAAFLVQGYVTQTHIHPPFLRAVSTSVSVDSDGSRKIDKTDRRAPSRGNLPANDDPSKCPLCQAVGHAGNFVWPHAAVVILPQLPLAIVPVAVALLRIPEAQSHDWRGRAPPQA